MIRWIAIAVLFSPIIALAGGGQKQFTAYDPQVNAMLTRMTLEEKIGQMTQPEQDKLKDPADIEKYFLGSLLSGGGSDPKEGNSLQAWTDLYDRLQRHTEKTRLRIPLLYGIDAVHGHNNVLGAVIFPHNIGLGCTRDAALVEKIARITAEEVRATGINWTFAPCVTVPQDERWGRTYEGYSEDPAVVQLLGAAAVRGLQGTDLSDSLSVLACAKHFVGDGGTAFGSAGRRGRGLDQGNARLDEAALRAIHLPGYVSAIREGVGTIMPSYSSWNGVKCSASKQLMTDLLKTEMGFEGFLISDYNAIDQITPDYKKAIEISINAGMDMAMVPGRYREYISNLTALVEEGAVTMDRIDDAARRILRVKFAMGLMDTNRTALADRNLHETFGSAEHRAVARQAVRESLVLLKNEKKALPISKQAARIAVVGYNADDLGAQCGGWTIEWQGRHGNVTPGGTTILAAIKAAVSTNTEVVYSRDGTNVEGASLVVAVVGEGPYAEGSGDRENLGPGLLDVELLARLSQVRTPVVVVLISGRPIMFNELMERADAVVAVWLPGTEGAGVADVLFGDYKPTGKLSFTWPRSIAQIPVHPGGSNYDPLFKVGFGLGY